MKPLRIERILEKIKSSEFVLSIELHALCHNVYKERGFSFSAVVKSVNLPGLFKLALFTMEDPQTAENECKPEECT